MSGDNKKSGVFFRIPKKTKQSEDFEKSSPIPAFPKDGHGTYTAEELQDTVAKAGVGYGRGGGHKYWRRVRVMRGGKLAWQYYYNNEKDRKAWAEQQKKKIKRKTKQVKKLKEKQEKHEEAVASGSLRTEFSDHFKELRAAYTSLQDLTSELVAELTGWEDAPDIEVSDACMTAYGTAIEEAYATMEGGEPKDLYGQQTHVLRALEVAMKSLPPTIQEYFSGSIGQLRVGFQTEDDYARKSGCAGWCAGSPSKGSEIFIAYDACNPLGNAPWGQRPGSKKFQLPEDARQYGQGSLSVEVILHEMAHAIHNHMGVFRPPNGWMPKDYDGPNWDDWDTFRNKELRGKGTAKGKGKEAVITTYGHTNSKEAFAESFAAAITHPKQMAWACPKAYEWMRNFMDPEGVWMHPAGPTDNEKVAELQKKLEESKDPTERAKLKTQIEKCVGLDEIDYDDDRINIFKQSSGSPLQQMMSTIERPPMVDTGTYKKDPPSDHTTGRQSHAIHDRFYEMNYRGRTVYVRYGKPSIDDKGKVVDYDPNDPKKSGLDAVIRADCIKEVFDENRQPLPREAVYWHLMQDRWKDSADVIDTVKVGGKEIDVTVADLVAHNYKGDKRGTEMERAVAALTDKVSIKNLFRNTTTSGQRVVQEALARGVNAVKAGKAWKIKEGEKLTPERRRELEAFVMEGEGGAPQPSAMAPHEITCNDFRQRSGTFTYDRWDNGSQDLIDQIQRAKPGSKAHDALVKKLLKAQPGISTEMTRDERGRFKKRQINWVPDPRRPGFMTPVFDKKRFRCSNPDGTQTVIDCVADPSGVGYRIADPMWAKLLTPNGEKIMSGADLERYCRQAAAEKRSTWVSVQTDRKREQTKSGNWKMAKAGDERSVIHAQVEFTGNGQPQLVGKKWSNELSKQTARIDDLFNDDPIFSKLNENARPVLEREQVFLDDPPPPPEGLPFGGQRVLLKVDESMGSAREKTIVAKVDRIIPGKKAGEIPSPPGWERMPEGVPNLTQTYPQPEPAKRLLKAEKEALEAGLLPPWYNGGEAYRKWFRTHFMPAYKEWNATKEAKKAEEYPATYIFVGEAGMGAGGRQFSLPESKVEERIDHPLSSKVPRSLKNDALVYQHEDIHPISGAVMAKSIRIKMPAAGGDDGLYSTAGQGTMNSLLSIPGAFLVPNPDGVPSVQIRPDQFESARRMLGGFVMTDSVDRYLKERIDNLTEASKLLERETHVMDIEKIDPTWLADNWGTALNRTLPNGARFTLGAHQQQLLQKLIDNDGRVLGAHYMGTGKTVSAIVAATMMMKRPYQEKLSVDQRVNMTPEDINKFYAENPPDPTRLDPTNPKRVLIVAPLNTVEQWRQAGSDFDGGIRVIGSRSTDIPISAFEGDDPQKIQDGEIVVVGPEYFTQHADKLKKLGFDGLIIDEVHMGIKNEKAERNKKVQEWNKDMNMMMLLTGTPMTTSPTDFIEYIRLLSKGSIWSDMTAKKFQEEYLEPTPVPELLGEGGKGAKLQVKAEKRAELAAILGQYMDVALPKHVRGKTLPATRLEENKHADMTGVQEMLFNLYMASLGESGSAAGLDNEEIARMTDPEARRQTMAAKAVANCIGFKAGSPEKYIRVTQVVGGKEERKDFYTFNPDWLMNKDVRGKAAGKWPTIDEIGVESAMIYDLYCSEILGSPYSELAGKPIGTGMPGTPKKNGLPSEAMQKAALKRMRDAEWDAGPRGSKIANPEAGELGIRFRGNGVAWKQRAQERITRASGAKKEQLQKEYDTRIEYIQRAVEFQRAYRLELQSTNDKELHPEDILQETAARFDVSFEEAKVMLSTHPNPTEVENTATVMHGGTAVTVTTADNWVSDTKGSLHRLYHPDQWDDENHEPISAGGFEKVTDGGLVNLTTKGLKQAGLTAPVVRRKDYPSKAEFEQAKAEAAQWLPPKLRYDASIEAPSGKAGLRNMATGETHIVDEAHVSAEAISLLDPGMRQERMKCDIAMIHQNAKCNELEDHITQFHAQGSTESRQMVLFGNGILDSCRTMEAKLRQMGFMDVNEAIEGSPHYDPDDPAVQGDPKGSPTGKYFVTYIGSTYTGNRDLNSDIFRKVKDRLDRDTDTSLFVHKITEPRPTAKWSPPKDWKKPAGYEHTKGQRIERNWMMYPGDVQGSDDVQLAQYSKEQREQVVAAFGIKPPESFVWVEGAGGTATRKHFYGTKRSEQILERIAKIGDPTKMMKEEVDENGRGTGKFTPTEESRRAMSELSALKEAYHKEAKAHATDDKPLTGQQTAVFNNCEFMVASDAAQVGLNWGNAVEMVQYDTLASPMAEDQRITRSARMLSPAVAKELIGDPVMVVKKDYKGDTVYQRDDHNEFVKDADGKKVPVMVQKYDDKGRAVYDGSGPFSKLREMESELFQARNRERPVGVVASLKINTEKGKDDVVMSKGVNFESALGQLAHHAFTEAEEFRVAAKFEKGGNRRLMMAQAAQWESIANKCQTACTLGPNHQERLLHELSATTRPGAVNETIITARGISAISEEIQAGTYDDVSGGEAVSLGAVDKIRAALNGQPVTIGDKTLMLTADDLDKIQKAGFIEKREGRQFTTGEAESIYMAIRSHEILTWIEDNRDRVEQELKSGTAGGIVTASDVANALIDSLSPEDRAILKTKKYLVNVRKLGAAGHVGRMVSYSQKAGKKTESHRVFTGFEKEHPVSTERRTRVMGRARKLAYEDIIQAVEDKMSFIPDGDFQQLSANDLSRATAAAVKSLIKLIFGADILGNKELIHG